MLLSVLVLSAATQIAGAGQLPSQGPEEIEVSDDGVFGTGSG